MSNEQKVSQAKGWLQALGIILLAALVVLDALVKDWELSWQVLVIIGFFALGARPETVAEVFGGRIKRDETKGD